MSSAGPAFLIGTPSPATSALGRLTQVRKEPTILAWLAAMQLLYGYEHPYGHPQWGNAAAIEGFNRADLQRFYETQIRPEQSAVIAVGDVALDELQPQLDEFLGTWKSASPPPSEPDFALLPPEATRLAVIDKPQAAQSVIHLALVGARRNTADFFALNVMNMVFGGQFSSRLNLNLREQKGYTYGARSAGTGAYTSAARWRPRRACRRPLPPRPWPSFSRSLTASSVPGRWRKRNSSSARSTSPAATWPASRRPRSLPRNWRRSSPTSCPTTTSTRVVPGVRAVTAEDVARVAKEYLALDRLAIVVVGDRAKIEPELRKLPVGIHLAVCHVDEDLRLLPAAERVDGRR